MLSLSTGPSRDSIQGTPLKKEPPADSVRKAIEDQLRAIDSALDILGQQPCEVESEDDVFWDPAFLPQEAIDCDDFDAPPIPKESVSKSKKRARPRLGISSFRLENEHFRVGDCVKLHGTDESVMLGRLNSLWIESDGEMMCDVQWFTVPNEGSREVNLIEQTDSNPVLSIEKRVRVLDEEVFKEHFASNMKKQDVFYVVPSIAKQIAKLKPNKKSRKKAPEFRKQDVFNVVPSIAKEIEKLKPNKKSRKKAPEFRISECCVGQVYPHESHFFSSSREILATGPWSKNEMESFVQGLKEGIDYQWGQFAAMYVPTRRGVDCIRRYQELVEAGAVLDSNFVIRSGTGMAHKSTEFPLDGQRHQVTIDSGVIERLVDEKLEVKSEAVPAALWEANPGSAFQICRGKNVEDEPPTPGSIEKTDETSPISEVVLDSWPANEE